MTTSLAIIGGGKIGEALLSGLIRRGGREGLVVCERSPDRAAQLEERHGVPALDLADGAGILTRETRRALAFGRLSPEDAAVYCALAEETIAPMRPLESYVTTPSLLPTGEAARWFILDCIRRRVRDGTLEGVAPRAVNRFLRSLSHEHQLTVLTDLVERWGALGADTAMLALLKQQRRPELSTVEALRRTS